MRPTRDLTRAGHVADRAEAVGPRVPVHKVRHARAGTAEPTVTTVVVAETSSRTETIGRGQRERSSSGDRGPADGGGSAC